MIRFVFCRQQLWSKVVRGLCSVRLLMNDTQKKKKKKCINYIFFWRSRNIRLRFYPLGKCVRVKEGTPVFGESTDDYDGR